eukprot:jgi/Botrbrau1/15932/Bobra.0253s0007.1
MPVLFTRCMCLKSRQSSRTVAEKHKLTTCLLAYRCGDAGCVLVMCSCLIACL